MIGTKNSKSFFLIPLTMRICTLPYVFVLLLFLIQTLSQALSQQVVNFECLPNKTCLRLSLNF